MYPTIEADVLGRVSTELVEAVMARQYCTEE